MQQLRLHGASSPGCRGPSSTARAATSKAGSHVATVATTQPVPDAVQPEPHHDSSRRSMLLASAATTAALVAPRGAGAAASTSSAGDWSSPGLAAPEDDALPKFFLTANRVKVQELLPGSGPAVQEGDAVLVDYVLRRSNGYFIYGTIEGVSFQPKDVPVGPIKLQLGRQEVIEGLETALLGMKQGGKRRILVPPEVGYVSNVLQPQMPTFATKRQLANHSSEPLLFEVELLRVLRT